MEAPVVDFFLPTAHKQAYEERGVLHRDIHLGNIFIDEGDDDHDISPEAKGKAENEGSKGMLGDWGHAQCFDIPHDRTIRKPTALPRREFSHHRGMPEYSDSDDEAWMNWRPKASEEPAVRTSQRDRKKKKALARPKSPTPSDSQMSDITNTKSKPTPDDLYAAFNPWYHEAPKELLDRTVSRQPFTQRYWSLTACVPGCCSIHRARTHV